MRPKTSAPFSRRSTPRLAPTLRRVLIRDHADRDAIFSQLMRYRDERCDDWADIIDFLSMHPDAPQRVVRLLGEQQALR